MEYCVNVIFILHLCYRSASHSGFWDHVLNVKIN